MQFLSILHPHEIIRKQKIFLKFCLTNHPAACIIYLLSLPANARATSPEGGAIMPKINGSYETIFIVDVNLGEEAIKALVEKFTNLIAQNGEVTNVSEWGKRRLAYPINDLLEGYYVLVEFNSAPEFPAELGRVYNITEGVMRSMIIAK